MDILEQLKMNVIEMDAQKVLELTRQALDSGKLPDEILNQALIPAMKTVGDQFERGDKYIPEMMLSASAMKEAMELLRPLISGSKMKMKGMVITGTVEGDVHNIGQNLVSTMLEGGGFEVLSLGVSVPAKEFIKAATEHNADLIAMSALLTTTMTRMPEVIDELKRNGLRQKVKVMIGGAPVTQGYADQISADGYAPDAASAVKLAERLLTELKKG